jgi:hypothetical protein
VRLATLVVVASMLLAVAPTLAEHQPEQTHKVAPGDPFEDSIVVEDDAYVKPGWWAGEDPLFYDPTDGMIPYGGGLGIDATDCEGEDCETTNYDQEIEWMWIRDLQDFNQNVRYEVDVTAHGAVVAAMDVFKVVDRGTERRYITHECPQFHAEDLFPREDEEQASWAIRVLRQTTEYHQRTTAGQTMSVDLFPGNADLGFMVAVYPQAGSGNAVADAASSTGETEISYSVSIEQDDVNVRTDVDSTQPDRPYAAQDWVGSPSSATDCALEGVDRPDVIPEDGDMPELPGSDPLDRRLGSLLDASLEP